MEEKIKRCLLLCKDKNFKANHNVFSINESLNSDVCYYAKIRILKQITTVFAQRSAAQRDVCYYAKIRILKQITTTLNYSNECLPMFVTMQR